MGNGCSDGSCGNKNRVTIENTPSDSVPNVVKPINSFPNSMKKSSLSNNDDI
jgi:hypothetical protein